MLDRGGPGATAVQLGGVRQQWGTRVSCLLARDSLRFYRRLAEHLGAAVDPGFRACGYVFVAHSAEALAALAEGVALQRSLGIPAEILEPGELAARVPALAVGELTGAASCPEDGYFDRPAAVAQAFQEASARLGVTYREAEVTALGRAGQGWSLALRDGRSQPADAVVVAAGCETAALLRPLGADLPITREQRLVFLSEPVPDRLLEPLVVSGERGFAAEQLADGRLLAADLRGQSLPRALACRAALLPGLAHVPLPDRVGGDYDMTPDRQPILGAVPGDGGLFVAAGFSGHGFMIAPEVGRLLAGAVLGDEPGEPLRLLAPDRFARGALVPEPQVV